MLTQDRFEAAVERVDLLCQVPVGLPVARAPAYRSSDAPYNYYSLVHRFASNLKVARANQLPFMEACLLLANNPRLSRLRLISSANHRWCCSVPPHSLPPYLFSSFLCRRLRICVVCNSVLPNTLCLVGLHSTIVTLRPLCHLHVAHTHSACKPTLSTNPSSSSNWVTFAGSKSLHFLLLLFPTSSSPPPSILDPPSTSDLLIKQHCRLPPELDRRCPDQAYDHPQGQPRHRLQDHL